MFQRIFLCCFVLQFWEIALVQNFFIRILKFETFSLALFFKVVSLRNYWTDWGHPVVTQKPAIWRICKEAGMSCFIHLILFKLFEISRDPFIIRKKTISKNRHSDCGESELFYVKIAICSAEYLHWKCDRSALNGVFLAPIRIFRKRGNSAFHCWSFFIQSCDSLRL